MTQKTGYPDFDEYIRQGEPSKREAAYAWSTANRKSPSSPTEILAYAERLHAI